MYPQKKQCQHGDAKQDYEKPRCIQKKQGADPNHHIKCNQNANYDRCQHFSVHTAHSLLSLPVLYYKKDGYPKYLGGLNFRGQFRGLNFEGHFRGINPKRNRWHSSVSFSIMFYWLCFCEGGNHGSFLSI